MYSIIHDGEKWQTHVWHRIDAVGFQLVFEICCEESTNDELQNNTCQNIMKWKLMQKRDTVTPCKVDSGCKYTKMHLRVPTHFDLQCHLAAAFHIL